MRKSTRAKRNIGEARIVLVPFRALCENRSIRKSDPFPPASRQPSRRRKMGVWIELEEGEPIKDALRRFRNLLLTEGAYPLFHCRWHKSNPRFYDKPSTLSRRRRWRTRVRKKGCGASNPEQEYAWADDLCLRPRRSWGPTGRFVAT
jgi:ribosomal protein S21